MNLKHSLLLLSIACCTIDTNCSASNGQYNIDYNNIDIDMLDKLEKLAGEKYADQNSLSDICDIFFSKLNQLDYEYSDSPFFKYGPLKLLQPFSKRTNRNRAFIIGPTMLLLLLDPTLVTPLAFLGSNLWNSIFIRNVPVVNIDSTIGDSKFFSEYDKFANAVCNFANTHNINSNRADQILQKNGKIV